MFHDVTDVLCNVNFVMEPSVLHDFRLGSSPSCHIPGNLQIGLDIKSHRLDANQTFRVPPKIQVRPRK